MWFRQSVPNSTDDTGKREWERFSDFENEFIEEAYQRKDLEVNFNGFTINFQDSVQWYTDGQCGRIPIKREEVHLSEYMREDRFCDPQRETTLFDTEIELEDSIFFKWLSKHRDVKRNFPAIANLAAQGILEEGKLLNHEFDAQRMADYFHDAINKTTNLNCAARLYTADSFLYRLINSALRSNDMSKIDTLGPFCYLLYHRIRLDRTRGDQVLYRGATLTIKLINEYKNSVGKTIVWRAFTSTSKDRRVAEIYAGNTLFIIFARDTWRPQNDISKLSYYPDEREVLLSPFYAVTIDRVELDPNKKKYLIYMTTASGCHRKLQTEITTLSTELPQ